MHIDKPQDFLHKGKKRPETAKPLKRAEDLATTEEQDQGVDLQRILAYYRERVVAHEQDRMQYLEKMDKLRIK